MTTITFELAGNITEEIIDYAKSVVVNYCENVETFRQSFENDEMTAVDTVIEECFNGNERDTTWWDDLSWFYSCNQREISRTYGWVRQTGRERFGDYDIPDNCYENPIDFMILVAYLWIIENTEVVEEIIRDFYEENPIEEDLDNSCDCCAKKWDECLCWCSECGSEYKECRRTCVSTEEPSSE